MDGFCRQHTHGIQHCLKVRVKSNVNSFSLPSVKGNRHFSPLVVMHPWGSDGVEIIVVVIVVVDCVVILWVVGLIEGVVVVALGCVGSSVVVMVEDVAAGVLDVDCNVVVVVADVGSEVVDKTTVVVEIVVLVIADVVPLHVLTSHQPYFT